MKAVAYSSKIFEKELLIKSNDKKHDITLISNRLTLDTISYAQGKDAVLAFSCDDLSAPILRKLKDLGVKYIGTRSSGTDHIDLDEAELLGLKVASVPSYSPESIAEHAITLILALCRNIIPAYKQTQEFDFRQTNLVGTTLRSKTVGIVGFGGTGKALAQILKGFGSRVIVNDIVDVSEDCAQYNVEQVSFEEILKNSDIISFHVPLTDSTRRIVNAETIAKMKDGVTLINISRGAVFNTSDIFESLKSGKIEKLGMDVYEYEQNVFFSNHHRPLNDNFLKALIQHERVLLTPHQAFLTDNALQEIAEKTIQNLDDWEVEKAKTFIMGNLNFPKAMQA